MASAGENRYNPSGLSESTSVLCFPLTIFSPYQMPTGTIKTKTDKGFGFIQTEGSDDVFFHHSACGGQYDNLQVGQQVQFDVEQGPKGPKASNVVAA